MATIRVTGIEQLIAKMERLTDNHEEKMKRIVYAGTGVVADAVRSNLESVPTSIPDHYYKKGEKQPGPDPDQKNAIINAFGISKIKREGGSYAAKVGFKGGQEANGVKVTTLARRVESGTSWMQKHPFSRPGLNQSRSKAIEAMKEELENQLNEVL